MKLIIGGVRGTNPVSQPDFMKFGGETTSFLVEGSAGECVLIDAGTGIRSLGHHLEKTHAASSVLLLLTHYHLDHIIGLPSLSLIYREHCSIDMASPVRTGFRVEEIMPRLFDKPFWPLQVEHLASHVRFKTLEGETSAKPMKYGQLEVRWCPVHHPGGCTAYRLDEPSTGASCVIATDMEWGESTPAERKALMKLCREPGPAQILICDGQYVPDNYARHRGWGHSTWKDAADIASEASVQRLFVTHHDPAHDDKRLADIERDLTLYLPIARLAREHMSIDLGTTGRQGQQ